MKPSKVPSPTLIEPFGPTTPPLKKIQNNNNNNSNNKKKNNKNNNNNNNNTLRCLDVQGRSHCARFVGTVQLRGGGAKADLPEGGFRFEASRGLGFRAFGFRVQGFRV